MGLFFSETQQQSAFMHWVEYMIHMIWWCKLLVDKATGLGIDILLKITGELDLLGSETYWGVRRTREWDLQESEALLKFDSL